MEFTECFLDNHSEIDFDKRTLLKKTCTCIEDYIIAILDTTEIGKCRCQKKTIKNHSICSDTNLQSSEENLLVNHQPNHNENDIKEMLLNEGIHSRDILPPEIINMVYKEKEVYGLNSKLNFLPLEIFDDQELDSRTTEDYANHFRNNMKDPLPAVVFVENPKTREIIKQKVPITNDVIDDLFDWYEASVIAYNQEDKRWTVSILNGVKRIYQVPRVYIRFLAEDLPTFVKRIVAAHKNRNTSEAIIKYNLYLDCMDVKYVPAFKEDERGLMIQSLLKNNISDFLNNKVTSIISEFTLDYQRAFCDLMWTDIMTRYTSAFQFLAPMPLLRGNAKNRVSEKVVEYDVKTFKETRNYVHWITLHVTPEVYRAMYHVVDECIKVCDMNLFAVTNYAKGISLHEFEARQNQISSSVIKYLKDTWTEKIISAIRISLRDVGKGWFNLQQKYHNVYDIMKLKRFMNLVHLRMQSALRVLTETSAQSYVTMLEAPALHMLNIDENFVWPENLGLELFTSTNNPTFSLELKMSRNGTFYSVEPDHFEEAAVKILDDSLTFCHQIQQVHPFLLIHLKFSHELYLSSVGLLEENMQKLRNRLKLTYQKSIIPLKAYAKRYDEYINLYVLNIIEYVENFKKEAHNANEIRDEISYHFRMMQMLERTIPNNMTIGPFYIIVEPLKNSLVNKRKDLANQLLMMFNETLRTETEEILETYEQIYQHLNTQPQNIEQVFELRNWIKEIPITLESLNDKVQTLKLKYDILDLFFWNLTDQDFQVKWKVIGFPLRIQERIEKTVEYLNEQYEKFYKVHLFEESTINEKIDGLVDLVTNIAMQSDFSKVQETANEAKRIWKVMEQTKEMGLLLNEHQNLFGMPVVPFEHLTRLIREFEPYQTLWITSADWLTWHAIWMENPFMNIDANNIEKTVNDMSSTMNRCMLVFREQPKIKSIAVEIKNAIDGFKPYLDIIKSLKNPCMTKTHYEEISKITGIDVNITPELTLKRMIQQEIINFQEIINTVSQNATREYNIGNGLENVVAE